MSVTFFATEEWGANDFMRRRYVSNDTEGVEGYRGKFLATTQLNMDSYVLEDRAKQAMSSYCHCLRWKNRES